MMVRIADEKQGDKRFELIRQISELADGVTLEYVKELSEIISDPKVDKKKKQKAFAEMDKVLRIAKQYSDRVLLAEGRNTENIGVGGTGITMIVQKNYPDKETSENACDD
jgi:hypothetical protein